MNYHEKRSINAKFSGILNLVVATQKKTNKGEIKHAAGNAWPAARCHEEEKHNYDLGLAKQTIA